MKYEDLEDQLEWIKENRFDELRDEISDRLERDCYDFAKDILENSEKACKCLIEVAAEKIAEDINWHEVIREENEKTFDKDEYYSEKYGVEI